MPRFVNVYKYFVLGMAIAASFAITCSHMQFMVAHSLNRLIHVISMSLKCINWTAMETVFLQLLKELDQILTGNLYLCVCVRMCFHPKPFIRFQFEVHSPQILFAPLLFLYIYFLGIMNYWARVQIRKTQSRLGRSWLKALVNFS